MVRSQVCIENFRDFTEHDSETTGSERAQEETEVYIHTIAIPIRSVPTLHCFIFTVYIIPDFPQKICRIHNSFGFCSFFL